MNMKVNKTFGTVCDLQVEAYYIFHAVGMTSDAIYIAELEIGSKPRMPWLAYIVKSIIYYSLTFFFQLQ